MRKSSRRSSGRQITIQEDTRIPGTNTILEAGDIIDVGKQTRMTHLNEESKYKKKADRISSLIVDIISDIEDAPIVSRLISNAIMDGVSNGNYFDSDKTQDMLRIISRNLKT